MTGQAKLDAPQIETTPMAGTTQPTARRELTSSRIPGFGIVRTPIRRIVDSVASGRKVERAMTPKKKTAKGRAGVAKKFAGRKTSSARSVVKRGVAKVRKTARKAGAAVSKAAKAATRKPAKRTARKTARKRSV